mmetsp:Transcript_46549/g.129762  ORF Transcript_46549/g.129762 Transcript_46549/m.129762 type:complete len:225 (-) Transcript_46549:1350-2024(-)
MATTRCSIHPTRPRWPSAPTTTRTRTTTTTVGLRPAQYSARHPRPTDRASSPTSAPFIPCTARKPATPALSPLRFLLSLPRRRLAQRPGPRSRRPTLPTIRGQRWRATVSWFMGTTTTGEPRSYEPIATGIQPRGRVLLRSCAKRHRHIPQPAPLPAGARWRTTQRTRRRALRPHPTVRRTRRTAATAAVAVSAPCQIRLPQPRARAPVRTRALAPPLSPPRYQ